ncbi:MAG TPA: PKD domain-containing protein [Anaerolineae bacterium]|nr:PKD domain-containing protein [Anaerolineae bacterium]
MRHKICIFTLALILASALFALCQAFIAPVQATGNAPFPLVEASEPARLNASNLWDLKLNENTPLQYQPRDGNEVRAIFQVAAPHVRIDTWLESGNIGAGSNAVLYVQYRNLGDAPATDVVITDTLQGMTYLGDTSGFPHTGSGGQVVWELGTVAPGTDTYFHVFVQIQAAAGEQVSHTVEIATSHPYDQGAAWEKWDEWSDEVQANDTRISVGKGAWTSDPAAGYNLVFYLNVCNNGGTASAQVTLTDTLHPSMTLQTWWSSAPGWQEVSHGAQELVVAKESIMGWRCETLYVRAHVDAAAPLGTRVWNQADVYASNDLSAGDNQSRWQGPISYPHLNLNVEKDWGYGQLVPGGELHYNINIHSNGNTPARAFRITETLPVSTTFRGAWLDDATPFTPTVISEGLVIWDVAGLSNGYRLNIEVVLDVAAEALPGTLLVNTAEVSSLPGEDPHDDNRSTWTETLQGHGPNLRVRKEGAWNNWGSDTRRASYWIYIENVGDTIVHNVRVTDTYPTGMYLDGSLMGGFWHEWDWRDLGDHLTMTMELLEPGRAVGFNLRLISDTSPLPLGLIFTNTLEAALPPEDVNPNDNQTHLVLFSGPDLFVEKTLVAGEVRPGELLTFSLRFGNAQTGGLGWWEAPGRSWLTDTLPAELEFVSAIQRNCGTQGVWCENLPVIHGNQLVWDLWRFQVYDTNELYVTVRVTDTVTGRDSFVNTVEITCQQPITEPTKANNMDNLWLGVALPYFEVGKTYTTTAVAGTPITYTLIITNSGHISGTGVIFSDTLPVGLTGVQGTLQFDAIRWFISSIEAGSRMSGAFSGILPCTGVVVNDDYRVVTSDQGVTSAPGAPVTMTVAAPSLAAHITQSAPNGIAGIAQVFTGSLTTNGPAPTLWQWDFGDGETGSGENITHSFTTDGVFSVTLLVSDTCGYTTAATSLRTITPPILMAGFEQSAETAIVSTTLAFTDTSVTDGAAITEWAWDFGDETTGSGSQTTHTYTRDGMFTVRLVVTDAIGYSDMTTHTVTILPPTLNASFTASPAIKTSATATFTDTSTTNVPPIVAWAWDFGDESAPGSGPVVTHQFTHAGTFTVTLTITDSLGYSDVAAAPVTVETGFSYIYLPLVMR